MPNKRQPIAFLARHGKDTYSDRDIFVSWTDVPLVKEGLEQADKVRDFLSDYDIDLVYSSPLQRCLQMAELLDKPIIQERALLPWNRGILTGVQEDEGRDLLKLLMTNPDVKVPNGESRRECEDRIEQFFGPAFRRAEKHLSVFFTHHSVIDVLNCLILGKRNDEPVNLVKAGGIVAVYGDGEDYILEPVLNVDEKSMAGMS